MEKSSKFKSEKKDYLTKEASGMYLVGESYFDDVETRDVALVIAMRTYDELQKTLITEAEKNDTSYVGRMKVVTGLKRCLERLDKKFPFLIHEMKNIIPRRLESGRKIIKC